MKLETKQRLLGGYFNNSAYHEYYKEMYGGTIAAVGIGNPTPYPEPESTIVSEEPDTDSNVSFVSAQDAPINAPHSPVPSSAPSSAPSSVLAPPSVESVDEGARSSEYNPRTPTASASRASASAAPAASASGASASAAINIQKRISQQQDALLKSNPEGNKEESIEVFTATINKINDLKILKEWATNQGVVQSIENDGRFNDANNKANKIFNKDKNDLINLYKKHIIDNYVNRFEELKCNNGIYNLQTCNVTQPCNYDNMCRVLPASGAPGSSTSGILNSPTRDRNRVRFQGQEGEEKYEQIRDAIYTELGNLSTTDIEKLMNTINSDIRRVTTQKGVDDVSDKILEYKQKYSSLNYKIQEYNNRLKNLNKAIRDNRLDIDTTEIQNKIYEFNSKLSEFKSNEQMFNSKLSRINIKNDRRDGRNERDRDNRSRNERDRDNRGRERDDKLGQEFERYNRRGNEIDKLKRDVNVERNEQRLGNKPRGDRPGMPGQPRPMGDRPGMPGQPRPMGDRPGMPGQPRPMGDRPGMPGQPQRPGMPGQPQRPGMPGQLPKRPIDLKNIRDEKFIFKKKEDADLLISDSDSDSYTDTDSDSYTDSDSSTDTDNDSVDVPDEPINKYMLNDLMHILKDVHHNERNNFINVLNNEYLYNNRLLQKYVQNVDDKHFDRFRLFIDHLNENTKDDKERVEMIGLIKNRNDKVRNKTFRRIRN